MTKTVIGIDVGTGSTRAGIFDLTGKMLASAICPIQMWQPELDHAEQSSSDIWRSVCTVTRNCRELAGVPPESVVGISFDATCSLVVLDSNGNPLPVNKEGISDRNIIVWMDHRALLETEEINAGGHDVLKYVGGGLSPEMEVPKLLWLKRHLPKTWSKAGKFFDLADYLTWRASGVDARSLCTVVCKWTYLGHDGGRWDRAFFESVGLADIFDNHKVVDDVRPMGTALGGLTHAAAKDLGLTTQCVVGVGIIDAHAGALGVLGSVWHGQTKHNSTALEGAIAMIGGTSNCLMVASKEPRFIKGVWGPYFGAMIPGMWLTEGGQSAAGSAIDHAIWDHANAALLELETKNVGKSIYELLNDEVTRLQIATGKGPEITKNIHILPDFIGNRSPIADPQIRGTIDGISLDKTITSQALRYYATVQAVAYGIRDNIETLNRSGYRINTIYVTGGGTKNRVWLQEHADATGCTIILPMEPEAVLLGAAILGATAAGVYEDIYAAMQGMSNTGDVIRPRNEFANYHAAKYRIFKQMYDQQRVRREAMGAF